MKKLPLLALVAVAVWISAPISALEAPAASDAPQSKVVALPAVTTETALVPNALPFAPVNLSTCTDLCVSEYNSCRLDCRFQPYPGCANDCWLAYQACLGGC